VSLRGGRSEDCLEPNFLSIAQEIGSICALYSTDIYSAHIVKDQFKAHAYSVIHMHTVLYTCIRCYTHAYSVIHMHTVLYTCIQCYTHILNLYYHRGVSTLEALIHVLQCFMCSDFTV